MRPSKMGSWNPQKVRGEHKRCLKKPPPSIMTFQHPPENETWEKIKPKHHPNCVSRKRSSKIWTFQPPWLWVGFSREKFPVGKRVVVSNHSKNLFIPNWLYTSQNLSNQILKGPKNEIVWMAGFSFQTLWPSFKVFQNMCPFSFPNGFFL